MRVRWRRVLSYDNLRDVELRTDEGGAAPRAGRRLVWVVVAIAIVIGIALALYYGPQITPLLDTLQ